MKLSKDCKKILDAVILLKPNNGIRFYTNDYVLNVSDLGMTPERFLGTLDMLESAKAIIWGDKQHTAFALTERGRSYKEIDRLEAVDRWKERLYGFLFGVLTAVVVDIISRAIGSI